MAETSLCEIACPGCEGKFGRSVDGQTWIGYKGRWWHRVLDALPPFRCVNMLDSLTAKNLKRYPPSSSTFLRGRQCGKWHRNLELQRVPAKWE
jgi:hypothetical protein